MFGLGFTELFIILFIVLLVFGAGKLGDVGGDFGKAIRNFRKAMNDQDAIDVTPGEGDDETETAAKPEKKKTPPTA